MDCRDISRFLDEPQRKRATIAERAGLKAHLQECPDCRDEWNAIQSLGLLSIPATPTGLLERIVDAIERIATGNVIPFPVRRTVIITSIVLIGSAAATLMLLDGDEPVSPDTESASVSPEDPVDSGTPELQVFENQSAESADADEPAEAITEETLPDDTQDDSSGIALDMATILVLPVENRTSNRELAELAIQFRDRLEDRLIAEQGLNVVDSSTVPAFRASGLTDTEAARALGAGIVVSLNTPEEQPTQNASIFYELLDAQAERYFGGGSFAADRVSRSNPPTTPPGGISLAVMERQVQMIRRYALGESNTSPPDEWAALLATISDQNAPPFARGNALNNLMTYAAGNDSVTTQDVIEAATIVATTASSPYDLQSAWRTLRTLEAPAELVPIALAELTTEQEERVRIEIVRFLGTHSTLPAVRSELQLIAGDDRFQTAGEEAEFALLSEDERLQLRRDIFFDASRPVEERLNVFAPLTEYQPTIDMEIAEALLEISAKAEDPVMRGRALIPLRNANLPQLIDPLLELIRPENEAAIREGAVGALAPYTDEPRVREALTEIVESDADGMIRVMATSILD